MSKWLSIQKSQEDLWNEADKQGYVWVKTKNGFITNDSLSPWSRIETFMFKVHLSQKTYGIEWALTKEELEK